MTTKISWMQHDSFNYSLYVHNTKLECFNPSDLKERLKRISCCEMITIHSLAAEVYRNRPMTTIHISLPNRAPFADILPIIKYVVHSHLSPRLGIWRKSPEQPMGPAPEPIESSGLMRPFDGPIPNFHFSYGGTVAPIEDARTYFFQQSSGVVPKGLFKNLNLHAVQKMSVLFVPDRNVDERELAAIEFLTLPIDDPNS